ncbi:MAG: 4-hydroxy-3-methylbut-2-enyl diphosphate reductase [Clostridia bacterium]|nr:4-hydroxy-3-methylbut-2-enyl diphosphate reductase [Clostridia bacterium]
MIIYKGKYSGFCFGVKRAVKEAYSLKGDGNFLLGEIIHNEIVNEKLKNDGLITVKSLDDGRITSGSNLLIRTHGEPKSTFLRAKEMGLNVIDCTCPFVKEIQNIVATHYNNGYKIVIIGNGNHPEVKGINGWCDNSAYIVNSVEELNSVSDKKLCIVVQTTYSEQKFDDLMKNFNQDGSKIVDIFKTICYTTTKRQTEADYISKNCDAVIVLGGANSNNTSELYDICRKNCINTFRVVRPSEFDFSKLKNFYKVGVVFGASTPIEQFQEVVSFMENVTEEVKTEEIAQTEPVSEVKEATAEVVNEQVATEEKSEFVKAVDGIVTKKFRPGQIIHATISSVKEGVGIDISLSNAKKDISVAQEELLSEDMSAYNVGDTIRVMVVSLNPLKVSEKAMGKVLAEEADLKEIAEGKIFEAVIESSNKGGLVGKYGRFDVFVPASQIRLGFVKDLDKYVGKTLRLKAEKVEFRRHQIVGSQRVILQAEKDERDAIKAEKEKEFFDNIEVGDVVLGTPVRFASFGAFISVNGFDCLAHISDLSWTGCDSCADVLELGKEYEFKILKIDPETKRVSVGYKQLQPKPWDTVMERYKVGDVIKGKVVRIVPFGAFVEIEKGIDGLVHVSEISNKWLENPVTALQVGQEVDVKILGINPEKEKFTLSIKALLADEEPAESDKKAKGKPAAKKDDEENLPREWKDESEGGASIAELLNQEK